MSDLVSIVNLSLEASRFLHEAGDTTVTKVIRVADLREAEMVLEFAAGQAAEKADRVLVATVFDRGGGRVAQVKTKGGGFQNFADRPGPLVVIVGEKTFRHLDCDQALWLRVQPPEITPAPPTTPVVEQKPQGDPAEVLAGCLAVLLVIGGLGGYAWYRHSTRTPPEAKTPALLDAGDIVIATAPPSHPGLSRDVMVRVEVLPSGRIVGASAYESVPEIARAAELAARHGAFAPHKGAGNETTTITVRFKPR